MNPKIPRLKWRKILVFHNLSPNRLANNLIPNLPRTSPRNINPDTRIKLESLTASSRRLRAKPHPPDSIPSLINKNQRDLRLRINHLLINVPHPLAHKPRLNTNRSIPDLPVNLRQRNHTRNRINHNHRNRIIRNKINNKIQSILSRPRLSNQQLVNIHPRILCLRRVKSVFQIKIKNPAKPLSHPGATQSNSRLPAARRPKNLNNPTPRNTRPQRHIKRTNPRRHIIEIHRPRRRHRHNIPRLQILVKRRHFLHYLSHQ